MPWTVQNPPRPARNWSSPAKALCTRVANAVLNSGKGDQEAIFACIAAVKRKYPGEIKGSKSVGKKADEHIADLYSLEGITFETVGEGDNARYITKGLTFAVAGKWVHPFWGEMNMDEAVLRDFKRNFDKRVLSTDVAIDERHDRGRAMGWIKSLGHPKKSQLPNGKEYTALLGDVEWTAEGRKLLEDKIYKYFSPEFGTYTEPDGKTEHKNVLLGGALTNRPFLKMMPAVKFGEHEAKGTAKDVFLFTDEDLKDEDKEWEFEDDNETARAFSEGYKRIDIDKLFDDDDEDEMKLEELFAQLKKDLGVEFSDAAGLIEALKAGAGAQQGLEKMRETLKAAGIQFEDKTPTTDIVSAIITTQATQIKTLSEQVGSVTKTLHEGQRETAVGTLIRDRKIKPSDKKTYEDMYDKDVALFTAVAGTLVTIESLPKIGEIGGFGIPLEPGQAVEYEDEEKAAAKGKEYLKSIGLTPKSEAFAGKS